MDNVDVFTVFTKNTVKDVFLDVRFSAHGSPYYPPEKLDSMVIGIQEKVRTVLTNFTFLEFLVTKMRILHLH